MEKNNFSKNNFAGKRSGTSSNKRSFKRNFNNEGQQGEKKPFKRFSQDGEGQKSENRPFKRSFNSNEGQGEKRPFKRNFNSNEGQGEKRPFKRNFNSNEGQGEKRPFKRNFNSNEGQGEKRPFKRDFNSNEGQGEKRPFKRSFNSNEGQGEKRPFKRNFNSNEGQGEKRPFKRSFNSNEGQGEKRPFKRNFNNNEGQGEKRPFKRNFNSNEGQGEKRPFKRNFNSNEGQGEKRPFKRNFNSNEGQGEKRPFKRNFNSNEGQGEKRPFKRNFNSNEGQGEKRPFKRNFNSNEGQGEKRPFKRNFNSNEGQGEKRPFKRNFNSNEGQGEKRNFNAKRFDEGNFQDEFEQVEGTQNEIGKRKRFLAYRENNQTSKEETTEPQLTLAEQGLIRLNRYIANAGICSRREADALIGNGKISVNDQVVTELGYRVKEKDVVKYDGKIIQREKLVYLLLNKPKDYITTLDDPENRKTVMDLIQNACSERVFPVGRLDRDTTGLLLLTNDGELAQRLSHPSFEIKKIYQVELSERIKEEDFNKLCEGVLLEDGWAKVDKAQVLNEAGNVVGLEIHLGRNRIIRRMFEALGYEVVKLDRTMYAGLTKKDLSRGHWRMLSVDEVRNLKFF